MCTRGRGTFQLVTEPAASYQIVGRDVPDESKERHTEIAVEVGHQDDSKKGEKSR
jgi:hypothetical protein